MTIKAIELNKKLSNILSDKNRAIKLDTLKSICRIGQGQDACRYIMRTQDGYSCVKNSIIQVTIDDAVAKDGMIARGNNCSGLTNKEEIVNGKEINKEESFEESFEERG